jgi:hypothetical protein
MLLDDPMPIFAADGLPMATAGPADGASVSWFARLLRDGHGGRPS